MRWEDWGSLKCRNRSQEELKCQIKNCGSWVGPKCKSLLGGNLYHCPRSSHGTDLGRIPTAPAEWLDFFDETEPVTPERLMEYYFYHYYHRGVPLTACNYCDKGAGAEDKHIPAGRDQLRQPALE